MTAMPSSPSRAFHVCGRLTDSHDESSNAGCSAPGTSCRMNFQFGFRFFNTRGGVAMPATAGVIAGLLAHEAQSAAVNRINKREKRRFMVLLRESQQIYLCRLRLRGSDAPDRQLW